MRLVMKKTLPAPRLTAAAVAISFVAPLLATPARADDANGQLPEIQHQIAALQAELARVKRDLAAQSAKQRAAQAKMVPVAAPATPPTPQIPPGYRLGAAQPK